jgi:hypothetical protein
MYCWESPLLSWPQVLVFSPETARGRWPAHLEYLVVSRLEGDVEELAHLRELAARLDEPLREVARLGRDRSRDEKCPQSDKKAASLTSFTLSRAAKPRRCAFHSKQAEAWHDKQ